MSTIRFEHAYNDIISLENLLEAWQEFLKGKRGRRDVQVFERDLMKNIIELHRDLAMKIYRHSDYHAFTISDPKPRNIHKAAVRDRLLHHALYRMLYPFFDRTFIADSYSCRFGGGAHKAIDRFKQYGRSVSQNHTRTAWVLKCDVEKFFASIDQRILIDVVRRYIPDADIIMLITEIISSFHSTEKGKGLPLGNLTSQLLVNVYMNEFDQFMKHKLKAEHYIRYADDFVILSADRAWLETKIPQIQAYLSSRLGLHLHPRKISLETFASGVDFLGWVHFPDHRVLRTVTKRRMFRNIRNKKGEAQTVHSYLGLMSHGNSAKLRLKVESLPEARPCKAPNKGAISTPEPM